MQLELLKQQIENNTLDKKILIFKCSGNGDFIVHQYLSIYRKKNNLEVEVVDDIHSLSSTDSLFDIQSDILKYYETDTLEMFDCKDLLWIKCSKISKEIEEKYSDNIVVIPKLENWQIKDYTLSMLKGVNEDKINTLFDRYENEVYRLANEIEKINIFPEEQRDNIYNVVKHQLYTDTSEFSLFDIVNCIVRRDKSNLMKIYKEISNIDVDAFGLLTILVNNFKHVIDIQLTKNPTAESVGVNGKQFWAIQKFSCWHYSKEELIYIYKLLTNIDLQIKTGYLDTSNVVDYIICKIMLI